MSQMRGADYHQLDDGEVEPDPYDPNVPRLRGGDASAQSFSLDGKASEWNALSANASATGYGHHQHTASEHAGSDDLYEIPAKDFHAALGLRGGRVQRNKAPKGRVQVDEYFDFNDQQQPNPWQNVTPRPDPQPQRPRERERERKPRSDADINYEVRRFVPCCDRELFEYLDARGISRGFLAEIDLFIQGHPEIATCVEGRRIFRQLNTLPPLQAYLFFLKGYTRPARYVKDIVRTDHFSLPLNYPYQPLSTRHDTELVDFFDGFDYRHDIIDRIDQEVRVAMKELAYGRPLPLALRKLVCYALWGNPIDAYKWFEYSYQKEYMPHRYLPEHVVLGHIPKPAGADPRPQTITGFLRHGEVRARMARANDQGVDVLDVLIAEYRFALVRIGHRRLEIDSLVANAKQRLEAERQDPTGVDIVDFIMDDAVARRGTNRRNPTRHTNPRNHRTFNLRPNVTVTVGPHAFIRYNERRAPGFLQAQAADLRAAKTTLVRLYTQEQHALMKGEANARESTLQMIRSSRASAERRYINYLIRYCRDANRMTPVQANQLQSIFTREKMGDAGFPSSNYLLGMYPRELY